MEQSRRDDLESIGYILIYLLNDGYLPWMMMEGRANHHQLKIKEETSIEQLTEGIVPCMYHYMKYVRKLRFEQKPDYRRLRSLFEDCFYNDLKAEMDN